MVTISPIDLFNTLKEKIGEAQAQLLTEYVTQNVDSKFEAAKEHLAMKEDLARETGFIRQEIAEAKGDVIKWMFVFWIGQIGATLGIIFLFLKK